jgi:cytochrome oxidase Cu insertion factor (SCO1/SenC/PrrC family)
MSKPIKANKVKGCLIGDNIFRVYDEHDKSKFVDYNIRHSDLFVIIDDQDAYFYNGNTLDHSPSTLGIGKNEEE